MRLRDLERISGDLASWFATLSDGSRYGIVQALRQTLEAAVRWGHINRNPAKLAGRNRQPAPRTVRVFTFGELDAIAAELSAMYRRSQPSRRRRASARKSGPRWNAPTSTAEQAKSASVERLARTSTAASCRRPGQDERQPPAGAAIEARPRRARRAAGAAGHTAPVPSTERRSAEPRPLPTPASGGRLSRPAGSAGRHKLQLALDFRKPRDRRRRAGVRASEDHGD